MNERKREPTADAAEILHRRYYEGHPERMASLEKERINLEVACKVYESRQEAGLTQEALAKLTGMTDSAISRIEDCEASDEELAALHDELQVGIESLNRGEGIVLEGREALARFFEDIKSRGRERLRRRKPK